MLSDHRRTLGVTLYATEDEVKDAYKKLIRKIHPDKASTSAETNTARTQAVNEAYKELMEYFEKVRDRERHLEEFREEQKRKAELLKRQMEEKRKADELKIQAAKKKAEDDLKRWEADKRKAEELKAQIEENRRKALERKKQNEEKIREETLRKREVELQMRFDDLKKREEEMKDLENELKTKADELKKREDELEKIQIEVVKPAAPKRAKYTARVTKLTGSFVSAWIHNGGDTKKRMSDLFAKYTTFASGKSPLGLSNHLSKELRLIYPGITITTQNGRSVCRLDPVAAQKFLLDNGLYDADAELE